MGGTRHDLLVVMLMPRGDASGVAAHTEILLREAANWPVTSATVVEPWSAHRWLRAATKVVGRLLDVVDALTGRVGAAGSVVHRLGLELALTLQVIAWLSTAKGRRTIVAQDPTSAVVVDRIRRWGRIDRFVLVAHFNGSEWDEYVARAGGDPDDAFAKMLRRREARAVPAADLVVVPSDHSARVLRPRHPDAAPEHIRTVHHAVPLPPLQQDHADDETRDLISIGTLEARKGHTFLLDVLARCHGRGRPLTLTIVGEGELHDALRARAEELGIGHAVHLPGRIVPAASLLPRHRVYVHASQDESFGLAVAEAMGAGLPVCAGPVGAIPELVTDGRHGLLWDLADPDSAAERLLALLDDPEALAAAGTAARTAWETRLAPDVASAAWQGAVLGP